LNCHCRSIPSKQGQPELKSEVGGAWKRSISSISEEPTLPL
jgi:hypothetical protein